MWFYRETYVRQMVASSIHCMITDTMIEMKIFVKSIRVRAPKEWFDD